MTKDEKTIFIKIKENPKTLKNELTSVIGKYEKTVQRCLNSLIKKKYISRIGTNQYGYWGDFEVIHKMNLWNNSFIAIKEVRKTIEMRLNDNKRRKNPNR